MGKMKIYLKNRQEKKGLYFTIDALIALTLVVGVILLASKFYLNDTISTDDYLGKDFVGLLANMKIGEINNSYAKELINKSLVSDVNNTILEQIGEFWANDEINLSRELIENITYGIIGKKKGLGVWIDDELVYLKSAPYNRQRRSYKYLISGIEKNKPIKGIVARATAQLKSKTSTKVVDFATEGAGWYGSYANPGEAEITKYFEMLENSTILNATMFVSMHNENNGPNWDLINFTLMSDPDCVIYRDDISFLGDDAIFDAVNVTKCIQGGMNIIKIKVRNPGYNAHIHPGMRIEIDYRNNITEAPYYSNHVNQTIFFDNVVSKPAPGSCSGAWQTIPFYIPDYATNISINVQINTKNVRNYNGWGLFSCWTWLCWARSYDVIVFLNDDAPFDSESSPSANDIYQYSYDQIDDEITPGTNLLSVFLNNYGDSCWGDNEVTLYSDPINHPEDSSYLQISYDKEKKVRYGLVEITEVKQIGGSEWRDLEGNYSFPPEAVQASDVYFILAQKYSGYPEAFAEVNSPASDEIFEAEVPRVLPTKILIPDSITELNPMIVNYARGRDSGSNYILPQSAIEYSFFIPISVPYGELFNTSAEAQQDAISRLNATIGRFLDAELSATATNITDVPTMWGPSTIELRVWE